MMKKKRKPKEREREKKELFLLEMYRPLRQKLKAPLFLTFFFVFHSFFNNFPISRLFCVSGSNLPPHAHNPLETAMHTLKEREKKRPNNIFVFFSPLYST